MDYQNIYLYQNLYAKFSLHLTNELEQLSYYSNYDDDVFEVFGFDKSRFGDNEFKYFVSLLEDLEKIKDVDFNKLVKIAKKLAKKTEHKKNGYLQSTL